MRHKLENLQFFQIFGISSIILRIVMTPYAIWP